MFKINMLHGRAGRAGEERRGVLLWERVPVWSNIVLKDLEKLWMPRRVLTSLSILSSFFTATSLSCEIHSAL